MTTIARATNDKGQVVEVVEKTGQSPHSDTPFKFYACLMDGENVEPDLRTRRSAVALFVNACAVEKDHD